MCANIHTYTNNTGAHIMFTTSNQQALDQELKQLVKDQGMDFAAGYLYSLALDMLQALPKRKQKDIIDQVAYFNSWQKVKVRSLMTGEEVEIRRSELGTVTDPSTERFWSM